jgi:uncharacterized protein (DUF2336 family)
MPIRAPEPIERYYYEKARVMSRNNIRGDHSERGTGGDLFMTLAGGSASARRHLASRLAMTERRSNRSCGKARKGINPWHLRDC